MNEPRATKTHTQALRIGLCPFALWACVAAHAAAPVFTNITMVVATPQFDIQSALGVTNQIQFCTNLSQCNWIVLTNQLVTQSPYRFVNADAPRGPQGFYRVLALGTNSPVPPDMTLIPAGSFTMGNCMNSSEGNPDELPLHTVYVSAFYIDKYEVTKSLWDKVYQWAIAHGYTFDFSGEGKAANYPVYRIDWYDCVKWCNARSEMEGLTPCYHTNANLTQKTIYRSGQFDLSNNWVGWVANGYRLPTEAEWEKAARGGASGHRFPWSDADTITQTRANYCSSSNYTYDISPTRGFLQTFNDGVNPYYTSPVGYFAANGYGLYDMAGDVWEWCWDYYGSYSTDSQTDPRGPASGSMRVFRGGTWLHSAFYCRTAGRNGTFPAGGDGSFGFRSVLPGCQ